MRLARAILFPGLRMTGVLDWLQLQVIRVQLMYVCSTIFLVLIQLTITQIWDQSGQSRSFNAHQGLITALSWQPIQVTAALGDDAERLLASAGEDGAISLWNARSSDNKSRCSMTMGSAVVALAFTPDGAFLAGATNQHVFIWKVDDVNVPRATWTRGDEVGWRTPQSHDSSSDEDQFSLCWDAHGHKLAYGVNSRVSLAKRFCIQNTYGW